MQYLQGRKGGILNRLRSTKWLRDEARLCLCTGFSFTPKESRERWQISGKGSLAAGYREPWATRHTGAGAAVSD